MSQELEEEMKNAITILNNIGKTIDKDLSFVPLFIWEKEINGKKYRISNLGLI